MPVTSLKDVKDEDDEDKKRQAYYVGGQGQGGGGRCAGSPFHTRPLSVCCPVFAHPTIPGPASVRIPKALPWHVELSGKTLTTRRLRPAPSAAVAKKPSTRGNS